VIAAPKAATETSDDLIAFKRGIEVAVTRPGTIRNPPPIPKKPDRAPTLKLVPGQRRQKTRTRSHVKPDGGIVAAVPGTQHQSCDDDHKQAESGQQLNTVHGFAGLGAESGASNARNGKHGRTRPFHVTAIKHRVEGNPDPKHVSTSFVERQNLNIRMGNRRMTRLTNAFSKKAENHAHMMAIYFMHYNFVRVHQTLKITPAMAAGVTSKLWEMSDMVVVLEEWEATHKSD
jgi:hypothetical protein